MATSIKFTKSLKPPMGIASSALKLPKLPKMKSPSVKMPGALKTKPFDFSKFSKPTKLPKSPKIAIIKSSIKKLKK